MSKSVSKGRSSGCKKAGELPDPKEFAKRTQFDKDAMREAVTKLVASAMADFDDRLAHEWTNYADDAFNIHDAAVWQHKAQSHVPLYVLNQVRSVVAEFEKTLKAAAATYLEMAQAAEEAHKAEARRRAERDRIKPAHAKLAELRKDPEFKVFMSAKWKAGWARRRATLDATQASTND